jgi:LAGLIDADG DNA endonuclease family
MMDLVIKKIVPLNISELLTPEGLAHLLIDDGKFNINKHSKSQRVSIYTNAFTLEEVEILAEVINQKFGIYTGVLHDRNDQYILTIGKRQFENLRKLVIPFMHPSMYYRVGINNILEAKKYL